MGRDIVCTSELVKTSEMFIMSPSNKSSAIILNREIKLMYSSDDANMYKLEKWLSHYIDKIKLTLNREFNKLIYALWGKLPFLPISPGTFCVGVHILEVAILQATPYLKIHIFSYIGQFMGKNKTVGHFPIFSTNLHYMSNIFRR